MHRIDRLPNAWLTDSDAPSIDLIDRLGRSNALEWNWNGMMVSSCCAFDWCGGVMVFLVVRRLRSIFSSVRFLPAAPRQIGHDPIDRTPHDKSANPRTTTHPIQTTGADAPHGRVASSVTEVWKQARRAASVHQSHVERAKSLGHVPAGIPLTAPQEPAQQHQEQQPTKCGHRPLPRP